MMAKKQKMLLQEIVAEEMQELAEVICEKYCKYGEQYKIDQEKYDDKNPTYLKHCLKCPLINYYTM